MTETARRDTQSGSGTAARPARVTTNGKGDAPLGTTILSTALAGLLLGFSADGLDGDLKRIDGMILAITTEQPIERWRFETVREECRALLDRAKGEPAVGESLQKRLADVERYERAAEAARRFVAIIGESRERDERVARVSRALEMAANERRRAYDAIGFAQPSARRINGRRVYALIGRDGSAIAYLDIPPGLDPDPLMSRRVGVRGRARFDGELGTRVIAVSDIEALEPRR